MQFCKTNANLMNFVNPGGPHFSPLRQSCRPPIMDKPTFVMNLKPSYFVRNPILTWSKVTYNIKYYKNSNESCTFVCFMTKTIIKLDFLYIVGFAIKS